ncbi:dctn1 [Symbiodinium sp. CCMP2456]|nr:dctn1 [Symbiodinium sp. CCMP2456]
MAQVLAGGAEWKLGRMAEPMRASFLQTVPDSLKVGARVEALGQFTGTVKFVGTTQFAAGPWIGVELDTPDGKNDGTIQGERYFDCKAGHGIFARPAAVRWEPALEGIVSYPWIPGKWQAVDKLIQGSASASALEISPSHRLATLSHTVGPSEVQKAKLEP